MVKTKKALKSNQEENNHFYIELRQQTIPMYAVEHDKIYSEALDNTLMR
jgi:hypothetical protein